jgi:renalase
MSPAKPLDIAVIGAGIAGSSCARALARAGHSVQVFDKSRGPGGRLATRRVEWPDAHGQTHVARLDHGAVAITADSAAFRAFVDAALKAGWLVPWQPRRRAGEPPADDGDQRYLPLPTLPALCRHLLEGVATRWSFAVDHLRHTPLGWQLMSGGALHGDTFDAVLLALPPAQTASLLAPHRSDWSRHASVAPMQPCWTLLGVAEAEPGATDPSASWDLARPSSGPLATLLRTDLRPGREAVPGQLHWVAHARAGWSRQHLEQPAPWVQAQLQAALARELGKPIRWLHSEVHRWRYAMPQPQKTPAAGACWWDAAQGLGVCGDFFGGTGVESAWLSAQSLLALLLQPWDAAAPGSAKPDGARFDRTGVSAA